MWHGSLSEPFTGATIQACTSSTVAAPTGGTRVRTWASPTVDRLDGQSVRAESCRVQRSTAFTGDAGWTCRCGTAAITRSKACATWP